MDFPSNSTMIIKGPHIARIPHQSVSALAPFTGLIISIVFVVYFCVRFYFLEGFFLKKFYGTTYTQLNETARKGFVNHHIAGFTKVAILIAAVYPFIAVDFGRGNFHTSFVGSSKATMGDVLLVCAQMLVAMYVFELFYRPKISPVSVGHHVGTIIIAQAALTISQTKEKDSAWEFALCLVWGAFDIVSEFFPHICIILYRVYPQEHEFLSRIFKFAMITTLLGTLTETVVTMWLFGSLWYDWTLAFKITTPLLHLLFMSCQLWGSYNFYKMWRRQDRLDAQEHKLAAGEEDQDPEAQLKGFSRPASDGCISISALPPLPPPEYKLPIAHTFPLNSRGGSSHSNLLSSRNGVSREGTSRASSPAPEWHELDLTVESRRMST